MKTLGEAMRDLIVAQTAGDKLKAQEEMDAVQNRMKADLSNRGIQITFDKKGRDFDYQPPIKEE